MSIEQIDLILEKKDRQLAGPTAAPNGLYLKEIRMKNNRILALSGNDIFSGGGLAADLATYTFELVCMDL